MLPQIGRHPQLVIALRGSQVIGRKVARRRTKKLELIAEFEVDHRSAGITESRMRSM